MKKTSLLIRPIPLIGIIAMASNPQTTPMRPTNPPFLTHSLSRWCRKTALPSLLPNLARFPNRFTPSHTPFQPEVWYNVYEAGRIGAAYNHSPSAIKPSPSRRRKTALCAGASTVRGSRQTVSRPVITREFSA